MIWTLICMYPFETCAASTDSSPVNAAAEAAVTLSWASLWENKSLFFIRRYYFCRIEEELIVILLCNGCVHSYYFLGIYFG